MDRANWAALVPVSGLQNDSAHQPSDGQALVWSAEQGRYIPANVTPESGGNVTGPKSSTPGNVAAFASADGTEIEDSGIAADTIITEATPLGGVLTGELPDPGLAPSGVTAGSYTNADLTVGADGRITAVSNGSSGGTGDVNGPASSTASDFAQFDGTTGKLLKDTGYSPSSFDAAGSAATAQANAEAFATAAANAAQAAAEAASYPGLGEIPLSSANAKVTWGGRFFVEDYANAQAAFTAACNANGICVFPPGTTSIGTLTWPTNFAGTVQIKGCGIGVSKLNGSIELVSNASPTVSLEDFTVTGGVAIDLTGSSYAAGASAGNISHVATTGLISYASSTHAFYLNNCGQMAVDGLTGTGTSNTGGNGLTVVGSSNLQASNVSLFTYGKGLNIGLGPCGHQYHGFRAVNCEYGIYATLDVNQGFLMSNWMVDNGNAPSTFSTPCVYLVGPGSGVNACQFSVGQVLLQNGGSPTYAFQLHAMSKVLINTCDFTFANPSDSCIYCDGGTTSCSVSQCAPGAGYLVHCASGTSNTRALGNVVGSTFLDNGSNTLTS